MASTRNKNTECNYRLEMGQYQQGETYNLYEHSSHGSAYQTRWAGNGLNPGQIPSNQLANNAIDMESFLFGIGSTNLVEMANPSFLHPCATKVISPDPKCLRQYNIYDTPKTILPAPMIHNLNERPFCVP